MAKRLQPLPPRAVWPHTGSLSPPHGAYLGPGLAASSFLRLPPAPPKHWEVAAPDKSPAHQRHLWQVRPLTALALWKACCRPATIRSGQGETGLRAAGLRLGPSKPLQVDPVHTGGASFPSGKGLNDRRHQDKPSAVVLQAGAPRCARKGARRPGEERGFPDSEPPGLRLLQGLCWAGPGARMQIQACATLLKTCLSRLPVTGRCADHEKGTAERPCQLQPERFLSCPPCLHSTAADCQACGETEPQTIAAAPSRRARGALWLGITRALSG